MKIYLDADEDGNIIIKRGEDISNLKYYAIYIADGKEPMRNALKRIAEDFNIKEPFNVIKEYENICEEMITSASEQRRESVIYQLAEILSAFEFWDGELIEINALSYNLTEQLKTVKAKVNEFKQKNNL